MPSIQCTHTLTCSHVQRQLASVVVFEFTTTAQAENEDGFSALIVNGGMNGGDYYAVYLQSECFRLCQY